jgi:hypothetical protein
VIGVSVFYFLPDATPIVAGHGRGSVPKGNLNHEVDAETPEGVHLRKIGLLPEAF